uniref:Uncharacterized protein n=1 Tax=Microcystis aeruginosa (strain PCC 7806) TaxID=267872 RepID=A8YMF8_MICA7|nr:unnamed protein product [Microcystis aeruginosa PCC 7806]
MPYRLANPHWTDLFNISIYLPGFVKKFIKIFYFGIERRYKQGNRGIKEKNLWIIAHKTGTLFKKIREFVRL